MLCFLRIEFCDPMAKMNKRVIEYAMIGDSPAMNIDEKGNPNEIWNEHVNILAEYMDFIPIIYSDASSRENLKLIENGTARIGSPQVAGLQ